MIPEQGFQVRLGFLSQQQAGSLQQPLELVLLHYNSLVHNLLPKDDRFVHGFKAWP